MREPHVAYVYLVRSTTKDPARAKVFLSTHSTEKYQPPGTVLYKLPVLVDPQNGELRWIK